MKEHKPVLSLEPCPCCGYGVKATTSGFGVAGLIVCESCHTLFLIPWDEAETITDLVLAWNRRVRND